MNQLPPLRHAVSRTLLIPLWCCGTACRINPDATYDPHAARLLAALDKDFHADFTAIRETFGECGQVTTLARERHVDEAVRDFVREHPQGVIVNLGCGLGTAGYRIPRGNAHWYDLDLPEVIRLRASLLPPAPGLHCLSGSLLEDAWQDALPFSPDRGILLLATGVFQYLSRESLQPALNRMAARFPGGRLLFDAVSGPGCRAANRYLRKAGFGNAPMRFSVNSARELERLSPRLRVRFLPYFSPLESENIRFGTRLRLFLLQGLRLARMVRLDFAPQQTPES